jgi:voltage-gated potassium channel
MPRATFRLSLQSLYFGDSLRARHFRYGLIAFDVFTIAVFLLASAARDEWWLMPLDLVLALVLSVELAARLYAEENRREQLLSFATFADVVVIGSLLLPAFVDNLGFLRVVRALRLLRSYHLLRDLRAASAEFRLYRTSSSER